MATSHFACEGIALLFQVCLFFSYIVRPLHSGLRNSARYQSLLGPISGQGSGWHWADPRWFLCLVSQSPRQQLGCLADGSQDRRVTIQRAIKQKHSGETLTSHTDPTSREPAQGSNPPPPDQELRALPFELPRPRSQALSARAM